MYTSGFKFLYSSIFYLLIIIFSVACTRNLKLEHSLVQAGDNREVLEKVLAHYSHEDPDETKYQAALYLIENMENKGYFVYELVDEYMRPYEFDIFEYGDYIKMGNAKKKFEDSIGKPLYYQLTGFKSDYEVITSQYLINHIDQSFVAWKLPSAKHLSFEIFCETILPYRIGDEPLPVLSPEQWKKIARYRNQLTSETDLVDLCTRINKDMEKEYAWRHKETELYPGLLSFRQIDQIKGGRCDDLNTLLAKTLRYVGVPVYAEFTPFLGNRNSGGHSWLSLLNKEKKVLPFNALYDHPKANKWPFGDSRIAKSYRKRFYTSCNIPGRHRPMVFHNLFLDDPRYVDNTAELINTFTIKLQKTLFPKNSENIYVGVLNGLNWEIIGEARDTIDYSIFTDLGKDILYQPLVMKDKTIQPISVPFVKDSITNTLYFLEGQDDLKSELRIKTWWWLRKEREYQCYYWKDQQWHSLHQPIFYKDGWKTKTPGDLFSIGDSLIVKVPENTILRFEDNQAPDQKDIGSFTRPFIIKNKAYIEY